MLRAGVLIGSLTSENRAMSDGVHRTELPVRSIDDLWGDRSAARSAGHSAMRRMVSGDANVISTAYAPRKSSSNSTMRVVRRQLTGHHISAHGRHRAQPPSTPDVMANDSQVAAERR